MSAEPAVPQCGGCGRTPEEGDPLTGRGAPWTWSSAHDAGRTTWLCAQCAREHARSIEAKLDTEWW